MGPDASDARRDRRRDRGDARDGRRRDGRRRGRAVVVGRADAPRPRRPAGAVARREPRRAAGAGRGGRRGRRRVDRVPARQRDRRLDADDEDYLIAPGPVERAAGDHPGPRRAQQDRRPHRHVGGGAGVPRPRHRRRRAGVLDAHRPAVRPSDRDRRVELPLPRGPALGPHAAAAARRAGRAAARSRRRATSCATAVEHYNRDPALGTTVPPPLWTHGVRRRGREARARSSCSRARSPTSPTSTASRRPTSLLDLALAEDLATEFRWRTESPEWTAAVGEAQLDARMIIGTSDGGAHLARDDGADWSSYFLRLVGARPARCGRSRRASARSPRSRRRCSASPTGACSSAGAPRRPDDLRPRHRSDRGRRSSCTTSPAASGASRPGATACTPPIVNGVPDRRRRRAHRPPARPGRRRPGCAPGPSATQRPAASTRSVRTDPTPVGVRRRRSRRRAAPRCDELLPAEFRRYAPRVLQ